jgi:hypothetical protein
MYLWLRFKIMKIDGFLGLFWKNTEGPNRFHGNKNGD